MSKQRVKSRFDSYIFFRGPRNQVPATEESALEQLRTFSRWLLAVPFVLTLIFTIGQLAIHLNTDSQLAGTDSSLTAEYSPWEYLPVRALREAIIEEIEHDLNADSKSGSCFREPILEPDHEWLEDLSDPVDLDLMP